MPSFLSALDMRLIEYGKYYAVPTNTEEVGRLRISLSLFPIRGGKSPFQTLEPSKQWLLPILNYGVCLFNINELGEWKRSSTCMILQHAADRWVVYRFVKGMIEQITHTADGETRRPIPLGPAEAAAEFDRDGDVIILRIVERHKTMPGMRREIRAALGGDVK